MAIALVVRSAEEDTGYRSSPRYEALIKVLVKMYPEPEQQAYIRGRWGDRAAKAETYARWNKAWYYWLRGLFVLFASIIPPAIARFAFTDDDHPVVAVATVIISILVGIDAAAIEICKPGVRWRLYQKLRFDLEAIGWSLAESRPPSPAVPGKKQFQRFVDRTEHLLSRVSLDYISQISVISATDYETQSGSPADPALRRRPDGGDDS
jgi:hypothetical protein